MIALSLAFVLFAGSDFTPRHVSVITNPDWVRNPNGADLVNYYPPAALEKGVSGHTSMECTVMADGTLSACHIISETPAGLGFGAAELGLASRFMMRPQTVDGTSVDGAKVVIPIAWSIVAETPPPPDAQPRTVMPPIIVSRGLGGGALAAAPEWAETPTDVEIDLAHPAPDRSRSGTVVMICTVGSSGFVGGCVVDSATSEAFASAALYLSSHYKVKMTRLADKAFIGARIKVWTNWPALSAPLAPVQVAPPVIAPNTMPVIVAPSGPPPPRPKAPAVITNPQWIRMPGYGDIAAYYPPQALKDRISGHTAMECVVKDDGTLETCHLLSESPAGRGFGAAELRLASRFKMRPYTVDGQPVAGARVVIPMGWSTEPDTPAPESHP